MMTIKEMYQEIGSDYEKLTARLPEKLLPRLVKKYAEDKNFDLLTESVEKEDYEQAFTAAHTLKGMAMNLGFDRLADASSAMTEELRANSYGKIKELYLSVKEAHEQVIEGIKKL